MKKTVLSIIKILVNLCSIPLFFIKIFHDVGVLPGYTADGEFITVRQDYYYNMMDNLKAYDVGFVLPIAIALIVCSAALSVLDIVLKDNAKVRVASNILFAVSVVVFLVLLFVASSVTRGY